MSMVKQMDKTHTAIDGVVYSFNADRSVNHVHVVWPNTVIVGIHFRPQGKRCRKKFTMKDVPCQT